MEGRPEVPGRMFDRFEIPGILPLVFGRVGEFGSVILMARCLLLLLITDTVPRVWLVVESSSSGFALFFWRGGELAVTSS